MLVLQRHVHSHFHFIIMTRVGHVNDWRTFLFWRMNNDVFLNGLIQICSMLWITYFGTRLNILGWSSINLSHVLFFGFATKDILINLCTTLNIWSLKSMNNQFSIKLQELTTPRIKSSEIQSSWHWKLPSMRLRTRKYNWNKEDQKSIHR